MAHGAFHLALNRGNIQGKSAVVGQNDLSTESFPVSGSTETSAMQVWVEYAGDDPTAEPFQSLNSWISPGSYVPFPMTGPFLAYR